MFDVMRTTLTIDDDVLDASKRLAEARGTSIGEIVSELARRGLSAPASSPVDSRNGIRLFRVGPDSGEVTPEIIARLLADSE